MKMVIGWCREKSIADSIRSRDAEIRMLVEEHLYLKKVGQRY